MLKFRFRFLAKKSKKISANSRLSMEWPRVDERSKLLLEAGKSAHITIIKLVT